MTSRIIRICLFDGLRLEVDGQLAVEFGGRKQDALLAYLTLPPRRPYKRAEIAAALWPGKPVVAARSRLAETLYRLNAELEQAGVEGIVAPGRHTLAITRGVQTDVDEFETLVRESGHADQTLAAQLRNKALSIYGGGLLPLITGVSRIDLERVRLEGVAEGLSTEHVASIAAPTAVSTRFAPRNGEDAMRMHLGSAPALVPVGVPPDSTPEGRLAQRCLAVAERAEEELWGSDRTIWLDKLSRMDEELRVAIAWAIETHEAETAVRLTGALWRYWRETGQVDLGASLIEQALELGPVEETAAYGKALHGAGTLAMIQGLFTHAAARCQRALVIWQRLNDPERVARSLCCLGVIAMRTRDYTQARRHFQESISTYQRLGLLRTEADVLKNAALVELSDSKPDDAYPLLMRRLTLLEGHNDPEAEAWTLADLATADQQRERWQPAADHLRRAKYLFDEAASIRGTAFTGLALGNVLLETDAVAEARAELEEARSLYHRLSDLRGEGQALRYLAAASRKAGDNASSKRLYGESLTMLRSVGDEEAVLAVEAALAKGG